MAVSARRAPRRDPPGAAATPQETVDEACPLADVRVQRNPVELVAHELRRIEFALLLTDDLLGDFQHVRITAKTSMPVLLDGIR